MRLRKEEVIGEHLIDRITVFYTVPMTDDGGRPSWPQRETDLRSN